MNVLEPAEDQSENKEVDYLLLLNTKSLCAAEEETLRLDPKAATVSCR